MIAREGDVVAASCRKVSDGWDVALYWNRSVDVEKYLKGEIEFCPNGYSIDAVYELVRDVPGWGLEVIKLLEKEREAMKEALELAGVRYE